MPHHTLVWPTKSMYWTPQLVCILLEAGLYLHSDVVDMPSPACMTLNKVVTYQKQEEADCTVSNQVQETCPGGC